MHGTEIRGALLVSTTTLAEPLVAELYRQCQQMGVIMEAILEWEGKSDDFNDYGHNAQAGYINPLYKEAMESFEAYLVIRAPFPSKSRSKPNSTLNEVRAAANAQFHKLYFERTATRNLRRNLCQYPTQAGADLAGMSLEEYTSFVVNACFLNTDNPEQEWLNVRARQQSITDLLNSCKEFRYLSPNMDISFRTEGRRWINSDGQTNMPSGRIYTSRKKTASMDIYCLPCLLFTRDICSIMSDWRSGTAISHHGPATMISIS